MRMERLIGIMCVLADAQRTTIGALAERFEVSTRTIARDLDTLGQAGVPLVTFPGAGGGVGVVAGLTGAGGPVLSVPIMIALGFRPLIAIGAGQVYSVPVALSGSAANFLHGAIDYKVGALMIVIQILGILLGVYMANRMDTTKLRKMVAWVCLFCGGFILVNAIRGILAM